MKGYLPLLNSFFLSFRNNRHARERLVIIIIITLLVAIWFRKGLMLGSGESGLPFYNPEKLAVFSSYMWSDPPLGDTGLIGYASLPFYIFTAALLKLNIQPFFLQAIMYWSVFITGTLSIHKLSSFIPGNHSVTRLSSSLFYIFNPVVHFGVLHRMQYPMIFFYGFIPLAFLLYYTGLQSKKLFNLVILSLLSIPFSFIFVGPAFLIMYFFILGSLTLYSFFSSFNKQRIFEIREINIYPFFYFFLFIVLFIPINLWWLSPFATNLFFGSNNASSLYYFSSENNVGTFLAISNQLESILSVVRMFSIFLFRGNESSWGWIYETFPFVVLSFTFFILFVVSMFYKKKNSLFLYFILLSIVAMFSMKGANPPLGFINTEAIKSIPFLGVFRNPFEKISLMLPFAMAIPVGFGVFEIVERIKLVRIKKILIPMILILIFPVYEFVIVNGYVFTGGGPPADKVEIGQYVKVPDYYHEAREWLDSQPGIFRLLVLPIDGEGMTYKWDYGYAGVELSNTIFDQPAVSLSTSQLYLPKLVEEINTSLISESPNLFDLTKLLNVRFVLVRNDIDYLARETIDPKQVLEILKKRVNDLTYRGTFGKLAIFEVSPADYLGRVFTASDSVNLYGMSPNDLSVIRLLDLHNYGVTVDVDKAVNQNKIPVLGNVVKGRRVLNHQKEKSEVSRLPFSRFSPDSRMYQLMRLKENLDLKWLNGTARTLYLNQLAGKRIAEIKKNLPYKQQLLKDYENTFALLSKNYLIVKQNEELILQDILGQQRELNDLAVNDLNVQGLTKEISAKIDDFFTVSYNRSIYPTDKNVILRYSIPIEGNYKILLPKINPQVYQPINEISTDIDGKSSTHNLNDYGKSDFSSLGEFHFTVGAHEISYNAPPANNLVELPSDEIVISTQDRRINKNNALRIKYFDSASTYKVSLQFLQIKGNDPVISLIQDTDPVDKNGTIWPRFQETMSSDNYDYGWHKYQGFFNVAANSSTALINFILLPWGNCENAVKKSYKKYCKDENFKEQFLKDSSVRIKDVKVERLYTDDLILLSEDHKADNLSKPGITFTQINPAKYMVEVHDAKKPFYLILSTTFDSRWKAKLDPDPSGIENLLTGSMTGNPVSEENHYLGNGYANLWSIDKLGSYKIYLEFTPEKVYVIGSRITLLSAVLYLVLTIIKLIRDKRAWKA